MKIRYYIFIAVLFISILFVSSKAYAGNPEPDGVKMYKSVIVYAGDTLESIAKDNYTDDFVNMNRYIKEIASINNMQVSSKLTPGNHIIVPYYSNTDLSTNTYEFVISMD